MARPKGSKSKITSGYAARTRKIKRVYGSDAFRKWGKKGGNPVLIRQGKHKKR